MMRTAMLDEVEDFSSSAWGAPGEVIPPSYREEPFALQGILRKITEEEKKELRSLLSSIPVVDPTFRTDVELSIDITSANDAFLEDCWLFMPSEEEQVDEFIIHEPEDVPPKRRKRRSRSSQEGTHCNICHKTFKRIQIHMRVHSAEKPYKCEICQKAFRQTIHLKRHYGTHLPEEKRKIFECKACHKLLSRRDKLSEHNRLCKARKRES